jgi:N-methylhydantoinase B
VTGPCGGGYGNPLERDPRQVLQDMHDGYISIAEAEQNYAVIITGDATVDVAATEDLRSVRKVALRATTSAPHE